MVLIMKQTIRYNRILYKKSCRLIPVFFMSFCLSAMFTGIMVFLISSYFFHTPAVQKIRIAVAVDDDSENTYMAIRYIGQLKSVSSICSFEITDKQEALKDVGREEVQAAILLTPDVYNDINSGKNTPVTVVFAKNSTMDTQIFRELVSDGETLIRVTEAAIYSAADIGAEYGTKLTRERIEEIVTEIYLPEVLGRDDIFTDEPVSAFGEFTLYEFYFSVCVTALLFFFALSAGVFYKKEDRAVEIRLKGAGTGIAATGISKIIVISTYLFAITGITVVASAYISSRTGYMYFALSAAEFLLLIPFCISFAAFINMVFVMAGTETGGCQSLLIAAVFLLIFGGGILPAVYYPQFVQKITFLLPLKYWIGYIESTFFGKTDGQKILIQFIMAAVFIFAAYAADRRTA